MNFQVFSVRKASRRHAINFSTCSLLYSSVDKSNYIFIAKRGHVFTATALLVVCSAA